MTDTGNDSAWMQALDDFNPTVRRQALEALAAGAGNLPPPADMRVNLHAHTFFSFNAYGYSPSHYAWLARQRGLGAAGIVDFDVLDGVEEFLSAAELLNLRACAGIESRVFVPEFAEHVMSSPGEPGVTYHMGLGFVSPTMPDAARAFLTGMRQTADRRNRDLLARVNAFLRPVELDYVRDVLPLTPKGNATERHICLAYARKAAAVFPERAALAAFWAGKLGAEESKLELPEGAALQNLIRAKTMKRGGPGYVQPGRDTFPLMADMNRFTLACNAIPAVAWLDGTSTGEQRMEELLDVAMASGVAALNIIPDRNFTPGVKDQKLANLYDVVALAEKRELPIAVGTEMNTPGQKFLDAFESAELQPLLPVFWKGACIFNAHTLLQKYAGRGYLSSWAQDQYPQRADRNAFYARVGEKLTHGNRATLDELRRDPDRILRKI